jgi:hypothetical protein
VHEDGHLAPLQFGQHLLEERVAEIVPPHVGGQQHTVEAQFVQSVGKLDQRLVGTVGRQAGESTEPARVLGDQLGIALIDRAAQPRSELRVVIRPRERHRHRHHLRGDPLPVHICQRRLRRPPHRDFVTTGRCESARRERTHSSLGHRVRVDINASTRLATTPFLR